MTNAPLVLASASPRRKALLKQIGVTPDDIISADIDETPGAGERPGDYVTRLAHEKAAAIVKKRPEALVLAADTAVAVGRRILPKAEDAGVARDCLSLLAGRSHRVYSGVALAGPKSVPCVRVVETRVKVSRLSGNEIDAYLSTEEWRGKAGGYAIQGVFARHVISIIGSYSNVVGLPLCETWNLLNGAGYRP